MSEGLRGKGGGRKDNVGKNKEDDRWVSCFGERLMGLENEK
jgi:hypothetical protein